MQSTDNNQYPEWQAKARAAQAAQQLEQAERQRREDEQEAEAERKRGEALGTALMFFGINAGTLERNEFEIDGFTFRLLKNAGKYMSINKHRDDQTQNYAWFDLQVGKFIKDLTEGESDYLYSSGYTDTIQVSAMPVAGDWSAYHAALASSLDMVTRGYNDLMDRLQTYRKRNAAKAEKADAVQNEKQHTPSDKLLSALTEYIESITPQRESDSYDF